MKAWIQKFLNDHRTAIAAIGASALLTVIDGIQQGHLSGKTLALSVLTAVAGIAKSALSGSAPSASDTQNSAGDPKPPLGIAP